MGVRGRLFLLLLWVAAGILFVITVQKLKYEHNAQIRVNLPPITTWYRQQEREFSTQGMYHLYTSDLMIYLRNIYIYIQEKAYASMHKTNMQMYVLCM
jgi:hypothetical protein